MRRWISRAGGGYLPPMTSTSETRGLPFEARAAVRRLKRADPVLGRLMGLVGPFRLTLRPPQSPCESLAQSIVYQQLNGKAAATILGRVCALFPGGRLRPQALLDAAPERLRGAGLSRPKMAAMKDLAAKALDGTVPGAAELERLDDDAIVERLTTIRGIGRWTVEMMLMFRLGRLDVFPVDDYGVRKGYSLLHLGGASPTELVKPKTLLPLGEKWKPYRSVAAWYLWRALEV